MVMVVGRLSNIIGIPEIKNESINESIAQRTCSKSDVDMVNSP